MTLAKYQEALLDISQFLLLEMKNFLIEEDRFKFRVTRYWNSIIDNMNSMNRRVDDTDIDLYGRTLCLLRKSIISEYKFLRDKKITPADATICILHRLYTVMGEFNEEFRFTEEYLNIKEIIDSLWANIRHPQKNKKLAKLSGSINSFSTSEVRGNLCINSFSLVEIEHPKKKEQVLKKETNFKEFSTKPVMSVEL